VFRDVDIGRKLWVNREKNRRMEDAVVAETRRILNRDLLSEKKILENLGQYNRSFGLVSEEQAGVSAVYSLQEIKKVSVIYRLKFLETKFFKREIPYEAVLKIKDHNRQFGKELNQFRILAPTDVFNKSAKETTALLFACTEDDNYFLIHQWGKPLKWWRKILYWPLRSLETLLITVFMFTLTVTLSLPTWVITLDPRAEYWSGYRVAAFLHIFIFNMGFTTFIAFAFTRNFSSSIWNRDKDFG
jgi:hypothetical protein